MKDILGGVCAPIGFSANGIHAGMRKNKSKKDLSLIVSEELCTAAATYTQNKVKGAPLTVTKQHLKMVVQEQLSVTQVMRIHVIQMVLSLRMKYVL